MRDNKGKDANLAMNNAIKLVTFYKVLAVKLFSSILFIHKVLEREREIAACRYMHGGQVKFPAILEIEIFMVDAK